jgi:ketosteroid isomerase-like protein
MEDHPNAALYRKAYDAFASGDLEAFGGTLADDVVWNTIGGETMHGAEAVADSMSGLAGLEIEISLHDAVANDDHVVGLVEVHVTAGDKEITYRTAEIHHVNADGKVTERWAFSDDTQAITDFFASLG